MRDKKVRTETESTESGMYRLSSRGDPPKEIETEIREVNKSQRSEKSPKESEGQRQEDTERRARPEESEMGANKSKTNTRETPTETRRWRDMENGSGA